MNTILQKILERIRDDLEHGASENTKLFESIWCSSEVDDMPQFAYVAREDKVCGPEFGQVVLQRIITII